MKNHCELNERECIQNKIAGLGEKSFRKSYYSELQKIKRIEEALRESEEKFRVLAETSSAVIYVYQGENPVYVNEAAQRITGYSRDELLKMKFWDIIHPDYQELVKERGLARQRGQPTPSRYEIKLITKTGEERWAELTAGRITYMGKPAGMATFFDITERKHAEEELAKIAVIVTTSEEAIISKHIDGIITSWNPGAEKMYGYKSEEVVGRSIGIIIPPEHTGELENILDRIKRGETIKNYETVRITKDGRRLSVSLTISPIVDRSGKITGASVIARDITERKHAEEIKILMASIVASSEDAILSMTLDGIIKSWNAAAERIFGYTADEIIGKSKSILIPPEHAGELSYILNKIKKGEHITHYETVRLIKDGKRIDVSISASPIIDDSDNIIGAADIIRDITERKRLDEKLSYLATYPVLNPNPIIETDLTGAISYLNPAASSLFPDMMTRGLGHPMLEGLEDIIIRFKKEGITSFSREVESDGSYYMETVIKLPEKDLLRIYAMDITERKRIEVALKESEKSFRAAFEQSAVGMTQVYPDGRYLRVNKKYCDITGYTEDELYGLTVADITYPPDYELEKVKIKKLLAGEINTFTNEKRYRKKDGSLIWVKLTVALVCDQGKPNYMAAVIEDITERKRAEKRLWLTQFAVDNFTDSSIWIRPNGQIIYVNDATCQNLGYTRDELLSMRIWDIDPGHYYKRHLANWDELKQKGALKFESTHVRKDGSSYPVEVSIKYLKFDDKEYMVTFDRNITVRKQKETELSDAKALVDLYLDLMGHDINNLNMVAIGYLELADNVIKSGNKLGEDNIEFIEKPMASLNNSSRLIDKVMKLRKLKAGELRRYHVDVCNVLTRIKDRYSHIGGRDITINYIPPAECLVMANELIDEVFINLVENSIKHSHKDKPLVIDILQTTVCEDGKEYFGVSTEDNGPGISDEVKKKIFLRFSRGETKVKGKGLGLYLVKTLVEDFQGRIWVEDRVPGDHTKGARFVVMLPTVEK